MGELVKWYVAVFRHSQRGFGQSLAQVTSHDITVERPETGHTTVQIRCPECDDVLQFDLHSVESTQQLRERDRRVRLAMTVAFVVATALMVWLFTGPAWGLGFLLLPLVLPLGTWTLVLWISRSGGGELGGVMKLRDLDGRRWPVIYGWRTHSIA